MPTIFECINARADAIKVAKWAAYKAFTPDKLIDSPSEYITIVSAGLGDERSPIRSTLQGEGEYHPQFIVIHRPTEYKALSGNNRTEYDDPTICLVRPKQNRWCIICKVRHPEHDFIHSKRYLNGLSFACKPKLRDLRRKPWHFALPPLDSVHILTIEKSLRRIKDDEANLRTPI